MALYDSQQTAQPKSQSWAAHEGPCDMITASPHSCITRVSHLYVPVMQACSPNAPVPWPTWPCTYCPQRTEPLSLSPEQSSSCFKSKLQTTIFGKPFFTQVWASCPLLCAPTIPLFKRSWCNFLFSCLSTLLPSDILIHLNFIHAEAGRDYILFIFVCSYRKWQQRWIDGQIVVGWIYKLMVEWLNG